MALENVPVTAGVGTPIVADLIGTDYVQVVKIGLGADGAIDNVVDSGSQVSASCLPVVVASDQVAIAVKMASGVVASGAFASGSIASGAAVSGAFADGSLVTIGAKADARSTATDTTAISIMSVLKQISYMEQTPASRAVTNAGTFLVQAAQATAASLNCTEASAGAIKTAVELIDDAIYIDDADWTNDASKHMLVGGVYQSTPHTVTDGDVSPIQVDSGGRQIVKLASNTGVDVGDVDVLSVVPGVAATSLGKAEDAGHTSADTGVMALAVRNDQVATAASPAPLAGTTLDYIPLTTDAYGQLWVRVGEATDRVRISKRVAVTASATGTAVWTPTSGKRFVLTKLVVSAKTAGDIDLFDATDSGNTVVTPILSLGAGGGYACDWQLDKPYRSAAVNNVLKFTTGTVITGSIYVEGWEE